MKDGIISFQIPSNRLIVRSKTVRYQSAVLVGGPVRR